MNDLYQFEKQEKHILENLATPLCVIEYIHKKIYLLTLSKGVINYLDRHNYVIDNFIECFNNNPTDYIKEEDLVLIKRRIRTNDNQSINSQVQLSEIFNNIYLNIIGNEEIRDNHKLYYLNFSDVTTQVKNLKNINASSERLSKLLNTILGTTQTQIFWKDKDRRFLGANKAFLNYFGFSSLEAILGKTDEDMKWHKHPEAFYEDELKVLKGKQTLSVHGKCIVKGEERDILASKAPLYLGDQIIGLVGSFEDITSVISQKNEIEKLYKDLLISSKNEERANRAKSDFMARMSHDMRTPLTTIIGLSDEAMDESDNEKDLQKFSQINEASHYLLDLLNDILDVEKFERGKVSINEKVLNLHSILRRIQTIVLPNAKKKNQKIDINIDIDNDIYVNTDDRWVIQILINLINNAIKYTHENGEIKWSVKCLDITDDKVITQFIVKDNGVGMSEEFLKKMYEPFSQELNELSDSETSSGLGLSIVKRAIDLFDGEISCESTLNKGTTFTIILPLNKASKNEIDTYKTNLLSKPLNIEALQGKKILLCEDVLINAHIIMNILSKYKMVVTHASNGEEGIELLKKYKFDGILMDIRMPKKDGLKASKEIREFNKDIPIIALSANTYKEDIEKSISAGMNAHLEKPIEVDKLLNTLTHLLVGESNEV